MGTTRRHFLATVGAGLAASTVSRANPTNSSDVPSEVTDEQLLAIAKKPVLNVDTLTQPVRIASMELLRNGQVFMTRVRTTDGAEGLAFPNAQRMREVYPMFVNRIGPYFVGKDAGDLEGILRGLYRHGSNYKFQGIGLWVPTAAAEFAVLDLLGRLTNKSIGNLLGGVKRRDLAVYRASSNRGNTPEQEIEHLQKLAAETGGNALKFRLGGRMSDNADSLPGRTEALIPLVRKTFGDDFTLYADANSSYDVPNSLRIGRLMEEHDYAFFEEPCPFDHLWETKEIADQLTIPVAGGEQEFSMRRFRWMILNRAVDVVQPDLHYFGGYIRSIRVARMANAVGIACTAHMGGSGLGYLDALHFASCIDDPGEHQEYKGLPTIPVTSDTSDLKPRHGVVRVPNGPGFGVTIDPDFVKKAVVVKAI